MNQELDVEVAHMTEVCLVLYGFLGPFTPVVETIKGSAASGNLLDIDPGVLDSLGKACLQFMEAASLAPDPLPASARDRLASVTKQVEPMIEGWALLRTARTQRDPDLAKRAFDEYVTPFSAALDAVSSKEAPRLLDYATRVQVAAKQGDETAIAVMQACQPIVTLLDGGEGSHAAAGKDEDLGQGEHQDAAALKSALDSLDAMIGLSEVKDQVRNMTNVLRASKRRRELGMKTPDASYHMVFMGPPGTGKTTVARLVAKILAALGITKRPDVVETSRSDLVGEYIGQTGPKTNAKIDEAMGGVLFIDEAYALAPANADRDYGQEAVETLLKRMEDDRDKFVVIAAGYQAEMDRFLDSNPGLRSRFGQTITFPDYRPDELLAIFKEMVGDEDYVLAADAEQMASQVLQDAWDHRGPTFGNARFVRNLFEDAVSAQASRLVDIDTADKQTLASLIGADIQAAYAANRNP